MANIVDSLKGYITSELISKASESFGESNSAITKGIDGLLPTILGGLVQKSNDTSAFGGIYDMIKGGATKNPNLLDNLGSLIGGGNLAQNDPKDLSGSLMSSLFGGKVGGILDLVSSVAGLKRSSSSGLMGLVGPMVMSYLGGIIKDKALDAVGLGKFLRKDSASIANALPAGMGNLLNLGFAKDAGNKVTSAADKVTSTTNKTISSVKETASSTARATTSAAKETVSNTVETSKSSLGKWILPLLALAALGYFFGMRSCGDVTNVAGDAAGSVLDKTKDAAGAVGDVAGNAADMAKDAAGNVADAAGNVADGAAGAVGDAAGALGDAAKNAAGTVGGALASLGDFFKTKLPNGFELNIPSMGVESKLVKFLGGDAALSKDTWYNFDRITFATGSANLDMDKSAEQLENIAQIMKAYPNMKIKLGGYTDNTGSAEGNMKLSAARANAVKAALVAKVIDATRIETEGYGSAHPVASNDTAEGRAQNRRIAINITAK